MRKGNLIVPAVITLINIFLIAFIIFSNPVPDTEAGDHRPEGSHKVDPAYIVVQFNPEEYKIVEIQVEAPLSGYQALEKTGLDITAHDFGDGFFAVCAIEGVGCPPDDCFCGQDTYWNYHYWDGTDWLDYQVGATETKIESGAVEGWRWGEFESYRLPPADEILPHE
jgi:hypothetical protein